LDICCFFFPFFFLPRQCRPLHQHQHMADHHPGWLVASECGPEHCV
jgi:hypothetical protein